jgi:fructose-bisphosphate aldolase class II
MKMFRKPENILNLSYILQIAEKGGFAVGAFSPRYSPIIRAVFRAGQKMQSPILVQIAQIELQWYQYTLAEFAQAFWDQLAAERPTVPIGLHLDHTQDFELIKEAIACGFTSVMIDASAKPLAENIAITRQVVEYAHARGVSVEAELGRIGTADFMESDTDEELFTDPDEAEEFVHATGVDALAVSVGTAHGVYTVRKPRVDVERIKAIRARTPVHLVLHGGSGTPKELIEPAIHLAGGGISKINVATDLELALLKALGRETRLTNEAMKAVSENELLPGLAAVQAVVEDKISRFLGSQNHADDYLI